MNTQIIALQKLENEMREIANNYENKEGMTKLTEDLWAAHSSIIDARQTLSRR